MTSQMLRHRRIRERTLSHRDSFMRDHLWAISIALFSTLGGCTHQPLNDRAELDDGEKPADATYVDQWQTLAPSETMVPIAYSQRTMMPSSDVVIARNFPLIEYPPSSPAQGENNDESADVAETAPPEEPKRERVKLHDGLWQNMRERLILADLEHPRIEEQIEFLNQRRGFVKGLATRAKPYLHLIVEEINFRGLPMDLALVPMVESGFQPTALSSKQAAGLWQIIPATGEENGLVLADGYDGRYNIYTSTRAALTYLQRLHKYFEGDWLLALAAYNAGEGRVQQAIAKNKSGNKETTYWDLELPQETMDYVPRVIALSRMIAYPKIYGLKFKKIQSQPFLFRVKLDPGANLEEVIAVSVLSPEDFYRFNPAFTPDIEPPQQSYNVLLPQDNAVTLAENLPGAELMAPQWYKVKKGDTLSVIAKRHGTNYKKLVAWNGLKNINVIRPGQKLIVRPTPRS